jgi:hypothetical protein
MPTIEERLAALESKGKIDSEIHILLNKRINEYMKELAEIKEWKGDRDKQLAVLEQELYGDPEKDGILDKLAALKKLQPQIDYSHRVSSGVDKFLALSRIETLEKVLSELIEFLIEYVDSDLDAEELVRIKDLLVLNPHLKCNGKCSECEDNIPSHGTVPNQCARQQRKEKGASKKEERDTPDPKLGCIHFNGINFCDKFNGIVEPKERDTSDLTMEKLVEKGASKTEAPHGSEIICPICNLKVKPFKDTEGENTCPACLCIIEKGKTYQFEEAASTPSSDKVCGLQDKCINFSEKCPFPLGTDAEECPEFDYIYFKEKEAPPKDSKSAAEPTDCPFMEECDHAVIECELSYDGTTEHQCPAMKAIREHYVLKSEHLRILGKWIAERNREYVPKAEPKITVPLSYDALNKIAIELEKKVHDYEENYVPKAEPTPSRESSTDLVLPMNRCILEDYLCTQQKCQFYSVCKAWKEYANMKYVPKVEQSETLRDSERGEE